MSNKEFYNLEVGKTFVCGNKILLVIEIKKESCEKCIMNDPYSNCYFLQKIGIIPYCSCRDRKDRKNVIFKELKMKNEKEVDNNV